MKGDLESDLVPRVSRNRFRPAALLGCIVGVVLIFAQLSTFLHLALVPHRFCALHGLEDESVVHAAHDLRKATGAIASKGPVASEGAPADGAHEACILASLTSERSACLSASVTDRVTASDAQRLGAPVEDASRRPGRRCLDFAPKIGPPA